MPVSHGCPHPRRSTPAGVTPPPPPLGGGTRLVALGPPTPNPALTPPPPRRKPASVALWDWAQAAGCNGGGGSAKVLTSVFTGRGPWPGADSMI